MENRIQTVVLVVMVICLIAAGRDAVTAFGDHREATDEKELALTKDQRVFGLVTIYRAAKQHFAMFEQVPELDWDKAFMDFLPLVEKEESLFEYYQTLRRFTVLLKDGHTYVSLPDSIGLTQITNLPLTLDYVEDEWVVLERLPTKEVVAEDIPAGSVVLEIEDVPAKQYIDKEIFPFVPGGTFQGKSDLMNWLRFFPGDRPIRLKFRYPDGSIHSRSLHGSTHSNPIEFKDKEHLEEYTQPWNHPEKYETDRLKGNILYVRYGACYPKFEEVFAERIESMEAPLPKALILDLRGNRGGSTPLKTVTHLISKPVKQFIFKTPCSISYVDARMQSASKNGQSKEEVADDIFEDLAEYSPGWYTFGGETIEPEKKHYDGLLVILTNRTTSSAAEDMVVILQGNKRATVIGEPTHGSTGQPIFFDLPGGGKVQICACLTHYADGRIFTGVGIQPDVIVKRTIQGIADGRDEVLEAAIDYLKSAQQANQVKKVKDERSRK